MVPVCERVGTRVTVSWWVGVGLGDQLGGGVGVWVPVREKLAVAVGDKGDCEKDRLLVFVGVRVKVCSGLYVGLNVGVPTVAEDAVHEMVSNGDGVHVWLGDHEGDLREVQEGVPEPGDKDPLAVGVPGTELVGLKVRVFQADREDVGLMEQLLLGVGDRLGKALPVQLKVLEKVPVRVGETDHVPVPDCERVAVQLGDQDGLNSGDWVIEVESEGMVMVRVRDLDNGDKVSVLSDREGCVGVAEMDTLCGLGVGVRDETLCDGLGDGVPVNLEQVGVPDGLVEPVVRVPGVKVSE
mmetsp:Transcript_129902/g.224598  ORF Transcript_129902/g.224598 Transcript_129902/m.224598 type:complete len:296 (-) Transcript_129902:225-1112(-)